MKNNALHFLKKRLLDFLIIIGTLLLIVSSALLAYTIAYNGKVYPNTYVNEINVSGNSPEKAVKVLSSKIQSVSEMKLTYQDQIFKIKGEDIDFSYNVEDTASNAYGLVRTGNFPVDLFNKVSLLVKPVKIGFSYSIDDSKLAKLVSIISGQISTDPVNPSASLINGSVVIDKGLPGREVDQEKLILSIKNGLSENVSQMQIPVDEIDNTVNDTEAGEFATRATTLIGKGILLKFEYTTITLADKDLLKLIAPNNSYSDKSISELTQRVASLIGRDPQEPKFVFENGKVSEFEPALDGIELNQESFINIVKEKIFELSGSGTKNISFDIPVIRTAPETSTDKVNDYGIKELIGRGTSTYYHSIPGRVHNISLAASRINGTLVKPGETFSFNQTLGDVSAFTGYQQAYIISEGKTILGDGGGVCQVSSTLFRAVLNAGLPIVERQAHAYRVGYYEQGSSPGFDATVYSPSPDFKFTNNTGNYVLVEAVTDTKNYSLVFELYGTKDGRTVSISKPVVTNVTAPPADVYQDDPSLPVGTVRQIDYKAWGAKVTFHYTVTRNGEEIINKTFISNYKPWAAVYLKGTGPVN